MSTLVANTRAMISEPRLSRTGILSLVMGTMIPKWLQHGAWEALQSVDIDESYAAEDTAKTAHQQAANRSIA